MSTGSGRATNPEISRYLAELVRREVEGGVTYRELAARAGVSHATLVSLRNEGSGAGWKTLHGLARAFGKSIGEIEDEARAFASTQRLAPRDSRVEYDTPRAPVVGAMEGYADAEAEARRRFRHIPDHVWEQVRELMGFRIRPPITAELLLDLANVVAKHGEPAPED